MESKDRQPPLAFEFVVNVSVLHHPGSNYNDQVISCEVDITERPERRNEKATKRCVYADVLSYFRGAELGQRRHIQVRKLELHPRSRELRVSHFDLANEFTRGQATIMIVSVGP